MSFSPSSTRLNDFATDLVLARPNPCGNCGPWPCYHICPNSPHYYSPEQERYDDMMDDGSDDIRERYAATMEAEQYIDYEDEPFTTETDDPEIPFEPVELQGQPNPDDTDDIPF